MGTGHSHDHPHGHARHDTGRVRLRIALGITVAVLLAEVVGAAETRSLALLVDAAHVATDAGGLVLALVAATLATRPPTPRRTWGLARAEVLAATAQAALLIGVALFVAVEAVTRLVTPAEVPPGGLLVFGLVGLAGNLVSAAVLAGARDASLNLRAAFLEVLGDAIGSVAVVVAAIVIATTGFDRADSVAALAIGALILPRAFRLLREAVDVLLEAVPRGLDLDAVREHLLRVDHVEDVHDLHVTTVASGLPVLTAHVTLERTCFTDGHAPAILDDLQRCVLEHFPVSIEHSTFQLEPAGHREHESTPHA